MNAPTQPQALYLYCLTSAERLGVYGPGLNEKDCIFSQTSGTVRAIVSNVNIDDFCGPVAEQNLQDPVGCASARYSTSV